MFAQIASEFDKQTKPNFFTQLCNQNALNFAKRKQIRLHALIPE